MLAREARVGSTASLADPRAFCDLLATPGDFIRWDHCYGAAVECEIAFAAQAIDTAAPVSGIFSFVPDSGINAAAFNPS